MRRTLRQICLLVNPPPLLLAIFRLASIVLFVLATAMSAQASCPSALLGTYTGRVWRQAVARGQFVSSRSTGHENAGGETSSRTSPASRIVIHVSGVCYRSAIQRLSKCARIQKSTTMIKYCKATKTQPQRKQVHERSVRTTYEGVSPSSSM